MGGSSPKGGSKQLYGRQSEHFYCISSYITHQGVHIEKSKGIGVYLFWGIFYCLL